MRVVVTGGSGKAGRSVVRDLVDHDFDVINVDVNPPAEAVATLLTADLTQFGEAVEALSGADAVVHLAAIPAPHIRSPEATFRINVASTFNIFSAAAMLGVRRVVWASSETVLGLPFGGRHARNLLDDAALNGHEVEPDYAPIDEAHPLRPHSSYSLSKVLGEEMARQFARWSGGTFIGLRFSAIREPDEYSGFPAAWTDPAAGEWNLWSYVDARDVAQASRLALTADVRGSEAFIIAAADTVMDRPSRELMASSFPTVPVRDGIHEYGALLSSDKARSLLGYEPMHSWRHSIPQPGGPA
jgi:nucleoside-diphosphate-sugar epimerase